MRKMIIVAAFLAMSTTSFAQQHGPQATDITEVTVSNPAVKSLPQFILSLDKLTKLVVTESGIENLSLHLDFPQLRQVFVTKNPSLTRLSNVSISGQPNPLVSVFDNPMLEEIVALKLNSGSLIVRDNAKLTSISQCDWSRINKVVITNNTNLASIECGKIGPVTYFNAADNNLTDAIWGTFNGNFGSLRRINVARNIGITRVPDQLAYANVEELYLNGTGIRTIPKVIPYMIDRLKNFGFNHTCIDPAEVAIFIEMFKDREIMGNKVLDPSDINGYSQGTHCNP